MTNKHHNLKKQTATKILKENLTAITLCVFLDNSPFPRRQGMKCNNAGVPYQNNLQLKPLWNNNDSI